MKRRQSDSRSQVRPCRSYAAARLFIADSCGMCHQVRRWALLGFFLRLPIVAPLAQLLADASGAEPRSIPTADHVSSNRAPGL